MKNVIVRVVGIISFLIAFALSKQYPGVFIGLAIVYVFYWLGTKYGRGYVDKGYPNMSYLNFIFWSNILTWILPIIGAFTAGTTLSVNRLNQGDDYYKYQILGYFGLLLSVVSAIFGIIYRTGH